MSVVGFGFLFTTPSSPSRTMSIVASLLVGMILLQYQNSNFHISFLHIQFKCQPQQSSYQSHSGQNKPRYLCKVKNPRSTWEQNPLEIYTFFENLFTYFLFKELLLSLFLHTKRNKRIFRKSFVDMKPSVCGVSRVCYPLDWDPHNLCFDLR